MATLTIENVSGKDVTLEVGKKKKTVGDGKKADLEESALRSPELTQLVAEGSVELVASGALSRERAELARRTMTGLLANLAARYGDQNRKVQDCVATVTELREKHNRAFETAEDLIGKATNSAKAAASLAKALTKLLSLEPEEDAIQKIEDEIADLEKNDKKKGELPRWFREREAKERELGIAKAELQRAKERHKAVHETLLAQLEGAAKGFQGLDVKKKIGKRIPDPA